MSDVSAILASALTLVGWNATDLWVASFGVGGNFAFVDVEQIIAGGQQPSPHEYDVLATTLNDHISERGGDHPVPPWADLHAGQHRSDIPPKGVN